MVLERIEEVLLSSSPSETYSSLDSMYLDQKYQLIWSGLIWGFWNRLKRFITSPPS
jgi:hypothetical protein